MRKSLKQLTQTDAVLNYLQRYGSIDRMTALTHAKCWNLGNTIVRLRRKGHDIRTEQGKRQNCKYVLYVNDQPVFSRFIKPKQQQPCSTQL